MESRNITVSYDQLKAAADAIQNYAQDFDAQFKTLYSAIDTLNRQWQGTDNDVFVTKINEFKGGVAKIRATLDDYIQVMEASAASYKQTQEQVVSDASKLANRL